MKSAALYPRLAFLGIKKNGRLYLPYILTCVGMVMMFYIVSFLSHCSMLNGMPGGRTMQMLLAFGTVVMAIFSAIFLFYTNSFLIRRRKREFGLYNILGMGKGNISLIMLWETLITYAVSMAAGLALGILISKACELAAVNILGGDTDYSFEILPSSICAALGIFAVIFTLIFLNALRQIHFTNPAELLRSENSGEKPPKANWVAAVLGSILLGVAYYMAITIEDPITAIFGFFVAVVLVIIASYLLFISGSVVLCRLLQKNKEYYYRTQHFVSVSQMMYRMRKNGAGLASICILSTMVLVTLSSTICLFTGEEDMLNKRYPRDVEVNYGTMERIDSSLLEKAVSEALAESGHECSDMLSFSCTFYGGQLVDNRLNLQVEEVVTEGKIITLYVLTADDYNKVTGADVSLNKGEALTYSEDFSYRHDTINIADMITLNTTPAPLPFSGNGNAAANLASSLYIIVDSEETLSELFDIQNEMYGMNASRMYTLVYFNSDENCCGHEGARMNFENRVFRKMRELRPGKDFSISVMSRQVDRADFNSVYGALFLLGIILGTAFVTAAVLIMYYKQVSEGYEDCARFRILRKVGMTDTEIKQSINSQVLTVFFMPLVAAGVHTGFAFPIIYRMLCLFGYKNMGMFALVTLCCFLVFAVLYVVVYKLTSRSYYRIVSE